MKPKYIASRLRRTNCGASLVISVQICIAGAAMADSVWTGSTSADWNTGSNWSAGVPSGTNAIINTATPNVATISANPSATPVDIIVGNGSNSRLDHTAGTAGTGGGNWMFVAQNGATASYNLADTSASGGTFTGFGQGSGTMNVGGRLFIGGWGGSGSHGTLNVNTSGTLNVPSDFEVATDSSTSVFNLDNGTVNAGGWMEIGNGGGCTGTLNMSGGTINKGGSDHLIIGANGSTGIANVTGGTINSNNETWVANNGGSTGTLNLSGGTINSGSWVAIGRNGAASATVNMTGGTWNKTNAGTQFIVGASGPATMNLSAGLVDVKDGYTWVGEATGATTAVLNISGTGEFRTSIMSVGPESPNATLNLNGGTLRTTRFSGNRERDAFQQTGTGTINFNGTQVIVTGNSTAFIATVDNLNINSGGMLVNTNGFNSSTTQGLSGTGGVVKSGAGTLTLGGANTYTGTSTVNSGKLVLTTNSTNSTSSIAVANGATLGIKQTVADAILTQQDVTLGTSAASTVDFDMGSFISNSLYAPLNVTGTLALNGTVTINLADGLPEVGTIPLVSYTTKTGSGSFTLGTLPNGVTATLVDTGSLVYLDVTSVALPRWDGTVDNVWDTSPTMNWIDLASTSPEAFVNGNPVLFDDSAAGPGGFSVSIPGTVSPGGVTISNFFTDYSFSGAGKISGSSGLLKQGTSGLTLNTANDYTGATVLEGGTISIDTIADAGSASSIGASSVSPSNLILQGVTLAYTGANSSTNRGFTIAAANTTIDTAADISFSGQVTTINTSNLIKTGVGKLTLSGTGANVIGSQNPSIQANGGTLEFNGSGTQTNSIGSDIWVGTVPNVSASVLLVDTTLTTPNWIAVGRGNGNGAVATFNATNSTIQTSDFSTGYDNGLVNNSSTQNVTLTNSTWNNSGQVNLAESHDSVSNMVIGGTSVFNSGTQVRLALGANTVASLTIQDSGSLNKTGGWFSVGNSNNGSGVLTVKDNGSYTGNNDFNVGDVDTSQGVVNLQDSGTITSEGTAFIGKNGGTGGIVNQTGGTFNLPNSPIYIGLNAGSTGVYNISAGTLNQSNAGQILFISREGTGTMNVSGTANVISLGNAVHLSDVAGGNGTLNLDGGTFTCRRIYEGFGGVGTGTLNFNGGLLKAGAGAVTDFIGLIDTVTVKSGGAFIDSNGNTISTDLPLLDGTGGGGLTKSGTGTLRLNGVNTYTGTTTVSAGALGGTGTVAGPLVVSTSGTLAPGLAVGTFTAGATTIAGTYACEIDGASADKLVANGSLNVSAATLAITQLNPISGIAIIASYTGSTPAPFAAVTGLPAGGSIDYNYLGGNQIAIITPYGSWASLHGLTGAGALPTADPDSDGQPNNIEFALGGDPTSGSDNAKIYSLAADSSDGGSDPELLMTIAVRSGTPAFAGTPSPSAAMDGFTYTVQGSMDLSTFTTGVTPVSPVTTGLPAAPAGYTYRTFSLTGSDGLPDRGFLRVSVAP